MEAGASRVLAAAGAIVAAALAACGGSQDAGGDAEAPERLAPPAGRANVVVIVTDDQRLDEIGVMSRTRRLIADRGARFATSVVSFPLCCPARATYLTGRYAHNHGVLSNSPEFDGGYQRLAARHALPVWLRKAGYATGHIGRYLNSYGVADPLEVPAGWDEWVVPPGPSTYLTYGYELNVNGEIESHGRRARDYQTDVFRDHAVRFIRERAPRRRPFFLSITPLAPHDENDEKVPSPFDGPRSARRHRDALADLELDLGPGFDEADVADKPRRIRRLPRLDPADRGRSAGSVRRRGRSLLAVDELVAAVVRELRRAGELGRTYLIFTSDNGFLLGEHRLFGKVTPYEQTLRVPLLVRGPGIAAGRTIEGLSANVDLAPTVAAIAGAEPTRRPDGISLLPALEGRRPLPDRAILLENFDRSRPDKPRYRGLRTSRYSYVAFEDGEVELYDLLEDPDQLENLAGRDEHRALERRLARRIERLRDCRGPACSR